VTIEYQPLRVDLRRCNWRSLDRSAPGFQQSGPDLRRAVGEDEAGEVGQEAYRQSAKRKGTAAERIGASVRSTDGRGENPAVQVSASAEQVGNSVVQVNASAVQVGNSVVQVNASAVQVGNSLVQVNASAVQVGNSVVQVSASVVQVGNSVVQVSAWVVQVGNSIVQVGAAWLAGVQRTVHRPFRGAQRHGGEMGVRVQLLTGRGTPYRAFPSQNGVSKFRLIASVISNSTELIWVGISTLRFAEGLNWLKLPTS
jgi:hypothetical protein